MPIELLVLQLFAEGHEMIRAYCRCNSGHYFTGEFCPLDGWSSLASKELNNAAEQIAGLNRELSSAELRKVGVCESTLERIILIDFGTNPAVFDAISPDGYFINNEFVKLQKLDQRFM